MNLKGAVLLLFAGVVAGAANRVAAQNPEIVVDTRPSNLVRQPDHYFDPANPPKPMKENEAAYTEGLVQCRTEVDAKANVHSGRKNQPCVATITVQQVYVTVGGGVTVFVPYRPPTGERWEGRSWDILKSHEEGHAQIYRDIFALVSQSIAASVFAKCPRAFNISIPYCTDAEIRSRMDQQLDVLMNALTQEAVSKITSVFREINEAYDGATDHGRRGGEGVPPSAENQLEAAYKVLQNFKLQARY